MKATLEIPDDLYRKVKAKSALSGNPVRTIAINLFSKWLNESEPAPAPVSAKPRRPAWFGIARPYAAKVASHDMASVRESIKKGRAAR
ncbi:MAG: hypothetical protein LBM92_05045 [Opitutaceae bacterium]|nr:hypothetical protein [Opitutaceae bacterium]